jgi:phosphoglycerol transferase
MPAESEVYSLTFTELLMPVQQHVFGPLANLRARFDANQVVHNEPGWELGALLGVAFVVGLVLLLVWALRHDRVPACSVVPAAAVGGFVAFIIATFGGVSELIAYLVSPQIRVWSRLTPFIAFFALVLLAVGLDRLCRALRRRSNGGWAAAAPLLLVTLFALGDQTSPAFVPNYQADAAAWDAAGAFVQRIEATTGPGAMVLQLPLHSFPEGGPVGAMNDYDHLAGYLHSDTLRWSYGGVAGRDEDWTAAQTGLPIGQLIPDAAAAGFAGVWIDLAAYPDHGAALVAQVRAAAGAGAPYFTSPDDRRAFVGLAPLQARLRARYSSARLAAAGDALTHPSTVVYGAGFYPREFEGTTAWYWAQSSAQLRVTNPSATARPLRFHAQLHASPGAVVTFTMGGRVLLQRTLGAGPLDVTVPIRIPAGGADVQVHSTGTNLPAPGDARDLRVQLINPYLVDPALYLPA